MTPSFRVPLALLALALGAVPARAAEPKPLLVGQPQERSNVPAVLAQDKFLAPQAVSAVDVSGDGQRIAVATMAFRHDRNHFVFSEEGKILWGRSVLPWAPFQVAVAGKGSAFAAAMAYSRITPPYPTLVHFADEKSAETVLTDTAGERGWLRYGGGDWRTGWLVSALGDPFVRAGDSIVTVSTDKGAWQLADNGEARKLAWVPSQRPYRMAASGDGRVIAFSYIVPDVTRLEKGTLPETFRVEALRALVSLFSTAEAKEVGSIKATTDAPAIPALPDPVKDFPELAKSFALKPDAVLPFRVAASVAVNGDGSRVAVVEYAGWMWVRGRPAIGSWDPPYHLIPFVPRQRGWLRITDASGAELHAAQLPKEGLFDVRLDGRGERAWCHPAAWFARGMAGSAWLPADEDARTMFAFTTAHKDWTSALQFPDAISDAALSSNGRLLVSCWDGRLYPFDSEAKLQGSLDMKGPARVRWSRDGSFAVAGTASGELFCVGNDGKQRWRTVLPEAEVPPLKEPIKRVFDEVPIYQVSRVGTEHAYVGDTWLIKTERGGFLIDTGGTSAIPLSLQRIQSAGVDMKDVRHLLHTHSHGDHCGAGYLWRTMGLKVVAPESADLTLAWLMPTLTDYGVWAPRPVDQPLALKKAGDEVEFTLAGVKIKAIFVPGHSFDSVLYLMELDGKRVVFTGDIGFDGPQEILHRCWGDVAKAKAVTEVVRTKVLPFKADFVFRGHGAKREGAAWLEELVKRSEEAIGKAEEK